MKLVDFSLITNRIDAGIMAFGFFDTIHLGHRKVIGDAIDIARRYGVPSSVFLFKNNIFPLLGVDKYPIFSFEERIEMIKEIGVDMIIYADANAEFLALTPKEFSDRLHAVLEIKGFTCGKDFTFGRYGSGTSDDLKTFIGPLCSVSELCGIDGVKISSESIKQALDRGDIKLAERMLGRPFSLTRSVLMGRHDGGKMGYPTINFDLGHLPIRRGVYYTNAYVDNRKYRALTNVGNHPTFADQKENVETYLLDFQGDLYGQEVKIEFIDYLREIVAFGRIEELVNQIASDVEARRKYD